MRVSGGIVRTVRTSRRSRLLRGGDFCYGVFGRKIKGRDSSCSQSIKKVQVIYVGNPGCLPEREAFFAQIVDRDYKRNLLDKLSGLFAQSDEEIVGDVEGDVRRQSFLSIEVKATQLSPAPSAHYQQRTALP